jgi:putative transposase
VWKDFGYGSLRDVQKYPDECTGIPRGEKCILRQARPLPTGINHVWADDFVFDTRADGRTLKCLTCLTVSDEFTREYLAVDVAGSIRSGRVIVYWHSS